MTGKSFQVYEGSLLKAAEENGPLSAEVETQLRLLDSMVETTLDRMNQSKMEDLVNFVLISDHGMSYGSNPMLAQHPFPNFPYDKFTVKKVSMEAALRPVGRHVRMVIGSGAYAMVYPKATKVIKLVLDALKVTLKGVDIYLKDEIPDHLHWKQSKYCPPILVLAKPGTVILKATSQHQRPASAMPSSYGDYDGSTGYIKPGISGYDPQEPEMRGVFMARGPGNVPDFNMSTNS
jgi:hypothetical protein